ncbi:protein phosphatase 2C domain-containing protein [Georgenia sp. M64]|uniref:PP2C family protein-serine/threonine phosphatase n=1 Tax=Georgenia sp. M64 TaxID=3120520 RepID=UPI0030DF9A46
MSIEWGVASDTGGRRSINEDAALARPPVFVVADGMGGHARGEMASAAVVDAFRPLAGAPGPIAPADVEAAVAAAAGRIRATMAREGADATGDASAGTTVAGAILTEQGGEPYWLVLNVGDSRVYRLAEGRLQQISVDHSLVQEMVDAGTLDAADARHHPRRNVITRAVGTGGDSSVDFWMLRVLPDERLLLCTDGLTGELEEDRIAEILTAVPGAEDAARALVAEAVRDGANDNVTVVVVDAGDPDRAGGRTVPSPAAAADEDEDGSTLPQAGA